MGRAGQEEDKMKDIIHAPRPWDKYDLGRLLEAKEMFMEHTREEIERWIVAALCSLFPESEIPEMWKTLITNEIIKRAKNQIKKDKARRKK